MTITSVPNLDVVDQNLSTSQSKRSEVLDVASHNGHKISFRNYGKIWIDSVHIYNMQAKILSGINVLLRPQSAFLPNHPRQPPPTRFAHRARTGATPAIALVLRAPAHARTRPPRPWARRRFAPQLRGASVHRRTHGRGPYYSRRGGKAPRNYGAAASCTCERMDAAPACDAPQSRCPQKHDPCDGERGYGLCAAARNCGGRASRTSAHTDVTPAMVSEVTACAATRNRGAGASPTGTRHTQYVSPGPGAYSTNATRAWRARVKTREGIRKRIAVCTCARAASRNRAAGAFPSGRNNPARAWIRC
ncbi:hypothetical protein B0H14DRAFT_3129331 [Mycena olivaceomarginata]|nr:hypothetical protein B0H14DRAFT_3129331 [Mycena olivaceomarginata]